MLSTVTPVTDVIRCQHCNAPIHRDDDGRWRDQYAWAACPRACGHPHRPPTVRHRHPDGQIPVGTANYPPRHLAHLREFGAR